jgi:hypothetical protein
MVSSTQLVPLLQKPTSDLDAGYDRPTGQTYYDEAPPDVTTESLMYAPRWTSAAVPGYI